MSRLPHPKFRRVICVVAVMFATLAVCCDAALACPTCGSGFSEAGEAGRKMLDGWFWSIVFMMSMPFTILASLGGYMYWLVRKARQAAAETAVVPATQSEELYEPVGETSVAVGRF